MHEMDGSIPLLGPAVGIMLSSTISTNSTNLTEFAQSVLEKIPGFVDFQQLIMKATGFDILYLALGILVFDVLRLVFKHLYDIVDRFLVTFLMSDICIDANDEIRDEVLAWFASRSNKKLGARSVMIFSGAMQQRRLRYPLLEDRMQVRDDRDTEINFIPSLGRHYFFPLGWRPFIFERECKGFMPRRDQQASQDITIRCFGWSDEPLRDFILLCKEFKKEQIKGRTLTYTYSSNPTNYFEGGSWGTPYAAPIRPLATVELDQHIMDEIMEDIAQHLDPKTAEFYKNIGIPWRRGYLFHGPPGTGKSSLSKALAGQFDLALYCMNIGEEGIGDRDLHTAFNALPSKCIVLLEDIDSAGIGREKPHKINERTRTGEIDGGSRQYLGAVDTDMRDDFFSRSGSSRITLSGLLNALDGASASEGRIVIMTSNSPEVLDSALIRPGRVDKHILLPAMSRSSAERMFSRMYKHTGKKDLKNLASEFASRLPDGKITPAELQGFILTHKDHPNKAVEEVATWSIGVVEDKETEGGERGPKSTAKEVSRAMEFGSGSNSPTTAELLHMRLPKKLSNGWYGNSHPVSSASTTSIQRSSVHQKSVKRGKRAFKKLKLDERLVVKRERIEDCWESVD
ncbi:uncharacterized protein PV09_05850 [Verruconis gallopava]|uniref:AAA+ ATPase domain-containing protein n=1 Tax=Verruconis gallopava TaxID=253628 RepID=A0A0D2AUG3_9PEZI|nr:uncharacterized protein PV09_05850 [Verruconis gallopava]KIW02789.1 hypothetical protein PV09_05850 [Verruconis gallopava]